MFLKSKFNKWILTSWLCELFTNFVANQNNAHGTSGKQFEFKPRQKNAIKMKKEMENNYGKESDQQTPADHVGRKPFQCNICESKFPQKSRLSKHINAVHFGEKPFKCENCKSSFSDKHKLNRHVSAVHEEKRPFKCNICNDKFKSKQGLDGNVLNHEGNKPFKCETCASCFSLQTYLTKHIEGVHEVKEVCSCHICGTFFKYKKSLQKHIATVHEGAKPYKCDVCNKNFTDKERQGFFCSRQGTFEKTASVHK